jgi:two-component system, NarL family, nitrate/nitrite response regulator NarL
VSRIEATCRDTPSVLWSGDVQALPPRPLWSADLNTPSSGLSPPPSSRISPARPVRNRPLRSVSGTGRVRSVIVDDSARFVEAISRLLVADGFEVVGVAGDRTKARRLVADMRPDVALIDLNLGEDNGIELIADIARAGLAARTFLILTSTCSADDLREIFEVSAAHGYLPKMHLSGGAVLDILHRNGSGNGSNNGNGHAPAAGNGRS